MKRSGIACLFVCLFLYARSAEAESLRQDNQVWFDGQYTVPIWGKLDLTPAGTFRLGRNARDPVYERAGISSSYRLLKWLSISPFYNYIRSQPLSGRDFPEHRYGIDGTVSWRLGGFTMSNRLRLERRILPLNITYNRYRDRFQIEHPFVVLGNRINVFLNDDIYYDAFWGSWTRNRFSAGIGKRLIGRFSADFYYLRQNDAHSIRGNLHVFGIAFKGQHARH